MLLLLHAFEEGASHSPRAYGVDAADGHAHGLIQCWPKRLSWRIVSQRGKSMGETICVER